MPDRPDKTYRPALERLEEKRPLSAGASAHLASTHQASAHQASAGATTTPTVAAAGVDPQPTAGYLLYRITNPDPYNDKIVLPIAGFVPIGGLTPVAGQTYNILQVAVRNGTSQTFTASNSNLLVRYPYVGHTPLPILTGDEVWKPGQEFVFYVLTHQYYPLPSEVHSGFEFNLDGARSLGIPGPSGIFLRVKYDPATFDQVLTHIVTSGPGAQGGRGIKFGLPDSAIYEFTSAKTDRNDFSGYF